MQRAGPGGRLIDFNQEKLKNSGCAGNGIFTGRRTPDPAHGNQQTGNQPYQLLRRAAAKNVNRHVDHVANDACCEAQGQRRK